MKTLKSILEHSVSNLKQLNRICSPLVDYFGSLGLTYHFIGNDGTYTFLTTRPDHLKDFLESRAYIQNSFICHPKNLYPGIYELHKHSFCVVNKIDKGMELYWISFSETCHIQQKIFLSEFELFKRFVKYFRQQAEPYLNPLFQDLYDIASDKGSTFHQPTPLLPLHLIPQKKSEFLKKIYKNMDKVNISKREKELIPLLIQGHSVPFIADKLNLSPRTVEHYKDNLKNKFNCYNSHELIEIGRLLHSIENPIWI